MQRERRKNNDILFHFRKDGLPMTKLSQLKIDPEFQNQINPPSFEETHQLEMNILKEERVLNPIITWNGYIVDGHTRYQIHLFHLKSSKKNFPAVMKHSYGSVKISLGGET